MGAVCSASARAAIRTRFVKYTICMGCGSNRYKSQRALTVHQKRCKGYKDFGREVDASKRAYVEKLEREKALKRAMLVDEHSQVPSSSSSHAPQSNDVPISDNDTMIETQNATGLLAAAPDNSTTIPMARSIRSGRSSRFPAQYKDFLPSSLTLPHIPKLPPRLPPPECGPSPSPELPAAMPTTAPPVYNLTSLVHCRYARLHMSYIPNKNFSLSEIYDVSDSVSIDGLTPVPTQHCIQHLKHQHQRWDRNQHLNSAELDRLATIIQDASLQQGASQVAFSFKSKSKGIDPYLAQGYLSDPRTVASLWPFYTMFGAKLKYDLGKPSMHVIFLHTSLWRLTHAYEHDMIVRCGDGAQRGVSARLFDYTANYPERWVLLPARARGATATDDIGSLAAHALQLETDTVLSRMRSVRSENHQGGDLTRMRDFFRERLAVLRDER
ncbi:hypothetical protein HETIRDRAFT_116865 [Heterobasidion irregulare TC 32-1]|uniref:Uncharacterized protein n=1 Tax=Heterobasidion irregulare (strain TC 32-1) TaxID=747525 RepID=W4KG32_HETIT|nr:uncharacterized protein HETIRDRAFT_116865 [Heterobasidion irregulare TC 32-1]ETW84694.1 hypothetical protein HETIRDRAFT_116865 [Heterobasidion irregulare TC 32-1]